MEKNKISIEKDEVTAYFWQYTNILSGSIPYPLDQILKLKSDFNFGVDKSNRGIFLKKLEFLTREEVTCYVEMDLIPVSANMPRHLDDPNEYVKHGKHSFGSLEIHRIDGPISNIYSDRVKNKVVFNFSELDLFKFYTKMYVSFEIYATEYDIRLPIKLLDGITKKDSNCELIIWGVYNKDLVYY